MATITYMERVLGGEAFLDEIDDFVDAWHAGTSTIDLATFLGMSWDEYRLWVERPNALRLIVAAREREQDFTDLLEHTSDYAVAARGGLTPEEVHEMREWLEKTGRLPRT